MKQFFISVLMAVICFGAYAQSGTGQDTTKVRQLQGAHGFDWKNAAVLYTFVPPKDTVKLRVVDSGAIAYVNLRYWSWTGYRWDTLRATGGGGSIPPVLYTAGRGLSLYANQFRLGGESDSAIALNMQGENFLVDNGDTISIGTLRGGSYGTSVIEIAGQGKVLLNSAGPFQVTAGNLDASGTPIGQFGNKLSYGSSDVSITNVPIRLTPVSTEPSGLNGYMYYNSSMNKFRVYEAGAWRDLAAPVIYPDSTLGIIYKSVGFSSLSDFVNRGATASVSGGNIGFSGGTNSFAQTLEYNKGTLLEQWHVMGGFKPAAKNSTSYGFGLGIRSTNATAVNVSIKFDGTDGSNRGKLLIYAGSNTLVKTATDSITFNAGDSIEVHAERGVDSMYAWSVNVTQKIASLKTSFGYSFASGQLTPNTGRFAVYSFGGSFDLYELQINSNTLKRPDILVIGDSKSAGYFSDSPYGRWAILLRKIFPKLVVQAGSADRIVDAMDRVSETISIQPKQIILCIGVNDVRNGIDSNTIKSNYTSYVNTLQAAGIKVVHLLSLKETVLDAEWFNNFIRRTYVYVIDTKFQNCSACLSGDNTHLNNKGNVFVSDGVINSGMVTGLSSNEDNSLNAVLSKGRTTNIAPIIGTAAPLSTATAGAFLQPKLHVIDNYPGIVFETVNSSFGGGFMVWKTRSAMYRLASANFGDSVSAALGVQAYVSGGSPSRTLVYFMADQTRNLIPALVVRPPDNDFNGSTFGITTQIYENLHVGVGLTGSVNFGASNPAPLAVNVSGRKISLFNVPAINFDSTNYTMLATHKTNGDTYRMYAPSYSLGTSGTDLGWSLASGVYTLNVPSASATARGVVTTGAQTFAGTKTYNDPVIANKGVWTDARTLTASTTIDNTYHTVFIDASLGNVTITLPSAASSYNSGKSLVFVFKRIDSSGNTITIAAGGGDTIDGVASIGLNISALMSKTVQSAGGTSWFITQN